MGSRTDGALKFTFISIAQAQHRLLARLESQWRGVGVGLPPAYQTPEKPCLALSDFAWPHSVSGSGTKYVHCILTMHLQETETSPKQGCPAAKEIGSAGYVLSIPSTCPASWLISKEPASQTQRHQTPLQSFQGQQMKEQVPQRYRTNASEFDFALSLPPAGAFGQVP